MKKKKFKINKGPPLNGASTVFQIDNRKQSYTTGNFKLHTLAVVFISPKDENDAVIKRVIATEHQVIQTR